jgi:HEPN domain-containing protein
VGDLPQEDTKLGDAVVQQAFEFWIGPEIQRRREAGELPDDFALHGAQVIFGMDEGPPEVRLNHEVKAVAVVEAARAIEKGEEVTEADIAGYKDIVLTKDDPDVGHITIVAHQGGWALAFDFRRNASRMTEHAEVAAEFLATARWAREQGFTRVYVDTLFSAAELMAKGLLIWQPDRSLLDSKTHRYIKVRFNAARRMANVDGHFADLLNQLGRLREPARYLAGEVALTGSEMDEMLAVGEEMLEALVAETPRRASRDGEVAARPQ